MGRVKTLHFDSPHLSLQELVKRKVMNEGVT